MTTLTDDALDIALLAVGRFPSTIQRERIAALRTMNDQGRNFSENAWRVDASLKALVDLGHLSHDSADDPANDRFCATQELLSVFKDKPNLSELTEPLVQQYRFTDLNLASY